jgi:thiopeptide-type bacteriocin biosynthesis protein
MSEHKDKRGRKPGTLFQPLSAAMLRAPRLPIESYLALAGQPHPASAASLAPSDPRILHALAISTPSLLAALERAAPQAKDSRSLSGKLLRFLIRMSTRPTPYGAFAGVALAQWGDATDLRLSARNRTRTRPDMEWLMGLVLQLESIPTIRRELRWLANPCVVFRAGRALLAERVGARGLPGATSIRATRAMRAAYDAARNPASYPALRASVAAAVPEATQEQIDGLLESLWQQGYLATDLTPPLTTANPALHVLDRLHAVPAARPFAVQLDAFLSALTACDDASPPEALAAHRRAALHASLVAPSATATPLQIDLKHELDGRTLSRSIGERAAQAAELLLRLSPASAGPPHLAQYRQQFVARYGADREVPLTELVSADWGLGPPGSRPGEAPVDAKLAKRHRALQRIAIDALRRRQLVVRLDNALLAELEPRDLTLDEVPPSLELTVIVLAGSLAEVNSGKYQLLIGPNVGAQQAGRHLGRFADLLGPEASDVLREAAAAEESTSDGAVWAELVYLPRRFRSANVTIRPGIRRYEIPLGVPSSVEADRSIPVHELLVGVDGNRFYLRWPPAGRVVASAGHMLNPMQASAEARLLAEIGRDGVAQLTGFDWGPAGALPFLPRVERGSVVLREARWRVEAHAAGNGQDSFREWLLRWRDEWSVPRHVYLSAGDNRLLLDLEDGAQAEELRRELGRSKHAGCQIEEALPGPTHAWLPGPDGNHFAELVVPLVASGARDRQRAQGGSPLAVASAERNRAPGSDWLYVRIDVPRAFEEDLLAGVVAELARDALARGLADHWFFIRYADPDPHLRIRFHGAPERLSGELLPEICKRLGPLTAAGHCSQFGFHTYEREIERYGGLEACALAERVFSADSAAVVELLRLIQDGRLNIDRVLLAIRTVDDLLDALGMDTAGRIAWLRKAQNARGETGPEFRQRREAILHLLAAPKSLGAEVEAILDERRAALSQIPARLAALEGVTPDTIYRSYVHMHCNRLLRGDLGSERRVLALLLRGREAMTHMPRFARPAPAGA